MPLVLAVVGAAVGVLLGHRLGRGAYRLADERDRPLRSVLWWMVPGLAVAYAGLAVRFDGWPVVVLVTYALAVALLAALMATDLDVHRLLDVLVLPAYPALLVLLAACSLATGDWGAYGRALVCGAAMWLGYAVLAILPAVLRLSTDGLGFGDVKLAGVLGLLLGWLDWRLTVAVTLGAFVLGGVVAIAILVTRRGNRHTMIAFGAPMVVAAVVAIATPGLA